jgi:hypothetical protein
MPLAMTGSSSAIPAVEEVPTNSGDGCFMVSMPNVCYRPVSDTQIGHHKWLLLNADGWG